MIYRLALVLPLGLLAGCSNESESEPTLEAPALQTAAPLVPPPNFNDRDGEIYLYTTAVSEEERKKGVATGDVVGFKYNGETDGIHRLVVLDDADQKIGIAECRNPCSVITYRYSSGYKDRVAFSESSVIGTAFLDAFNGHLKTAKLREKKVKRSPEAVEPASIENAPPESEGPDVPLADK